MYFFLSSRIMYVCMYITSSPGSSTLGLGRPELLLCANFAFINVHCSLLYSSVSCCSHVQVLETLFHVFHINYKPTKWKLNFWLSENSEKFYKLCIRKM